MFFFNLVSGVLKGYDALNNMVIDNAVEYLNAAREDVEGMGPTADIAARGGDPSATRCELSFYPVWKLTCKMLAILCLFFNYIGL